MEGQGKFVSFLPIYSHKFCRLLISFANCLDPDQDRHLVVPDFIKSFTA